MVRARPAVWASPMARRARPAAKVGLHAFGRRAARMVMAAARSAMITRRHHSGPGPLLDEAPAESLRDGGRSVRRPQLLEDVLEVRLDGIGGDKQLLGDVPVGVTERQKLEDLDLAGGEGLRLAV